MRQVLENTKSAERQYALPQRANRTRHAKQWGERDRFGSRPSEDLDNLRRLEVKAVKPRHKRHGNDLRDSPANAKDRSGQRKDKAVNFFRRAEIHFGLPQIVAGSTARDDWELKTAAKAGALARTNPRSGTHPSRTAVE